MEQKNYSFLTETLSFVAVETKGGKQYYVQGYISTPEMDLYNDVVTPKALTSMLRQIEEQTITLDYDHEVFREDNTRLPVGKIVDAKIDDRGLWVKCQLNRHSPKFKALWGSIKDGFITAFSIAFKPLKTVMKQIADTEVRLIEELDLLNVALTGVPVNTGAVMTDYGMKAVMLKAITEHKSNKEEDIMTNEKQPEVKDEGAEKPAEAPAEAPKEEAPAEEAPKAEEKPAEEAPKEEPAKVEGKSESIEKLEADMKALTEELKATKAELQTIKDAPVFKSNTPAPAPTATEEKAKTVMDAIR